MPTLTCTRCQEPIDTAAGYLVAGDEMQFTNAADPKLATCEEAMHFVCPAAAAPKPVRITTFDQIHASVAEHWRREAVRNTPKAVARRAIFTLSSALAELDAADRAETLAVLRDEIPGLPATA